MQPVKFLHKERHMAPPSVTLSHRSAVQDGGNFDLGYLIRTMDASLLDSQITEFLEGG